MTQDEEDELKRRLAIEALRKEHRGVMKRIADGKMTAEDAAFVKMLFNMMLLQQQMLESRKAND